MTLIIGPNNFFKKSYVINLARRKDRYHEFELMIKQDNIGEIERFDAIQDKIDGARGCAASHIAIINLAKHKGYENVLIFEDDAMFANGMKFILNPALNQLMSLKWDFFYFGGRLIAPAKIVSPNLAKIIGTYCTHAYAVNHTMYDRILKYDYSKDGPIDVFYSLITREVNSYICYPIACYQRPSVSDLIGGPMDYRELLKKSYKEHIKF